MQLLELSIPIQGNQLNPNLLNSLIEVSTILIGWKFRMTIDFG